MCPPCLGAQSSKYNEVQHLEGSRVCPVSRRGRWVTPAPSSADALSAEMAGAGGGGGDTGLSGGYSCLPTGKAQYKRKGLDGRSDRLEKGLRDLEGGTYRGGWGT